MLDAKSAKLTQLVFFLSFMSICLTAVDWFELLNDFELVLKLVIIAPVSISMTAALYYVVYVRN